MRQVNNENDLREMVFPYGGLQLTHPSEMSRPDTTEVAENVRFFETFTGRGRGGSRAGLSRSIDEQVSGDHEIQHMGAIVTVDGEMIDWSFDGPNQRFPGIYAGIGFIDLNLGQFGLVRYTLQYPDETQRDDGVAGSETFTGGSGYPPKKPKNEKIVARLVTDAYEVSLNTPNQLTATLRDKDGGLLTAETLTDKNIVLHTDPPGNVGDGDFGSAGGSEMTPLVQSDHTGTIDYWVTVVSVLGNVVATSNRVHVKYGKLTTIINWSNPASITQGTALSGTQLNATASAPGFPGVLGTFTYTPPSGTVLALGLQTLSVSFVPTDTATYSIPADKTVSITVTEAGSDLTVDDTVGVSIDSVDPPGGVAGTTVQTSSFTILPATPHAGVSAQPDPGMTQWPNIPDAGVPIQLYRTSGVWYYVFTA